MFKLISYLEKNYWTPRLEDTTLSINTVVGWLTNNSERVEVSASKWDGNIVSVNGGVYYTGSKMTNEIEFIIHKAAVVLDSGVRRAA